MSVSVTDLKNIYRDHPKNQLIDEALNQNSAKLHLRGLVGSASAIISSTFFESNPSLQLCILPEKEEAAYFMNDIESLIDGKKLLFFPRSARVPYQPEVTENANISMRTEVLNAIRKNPSELIVVTFPEALAEKVVTLETLASNTFDIHIGDELTMDFLNEFLIEHGFEKVDYVYEPGQFSERGGIVDIFSFSFDHPYRIEFFGDEIDSIRKFDPVSQLSVNPMTKATIVPHFKESNKAEKRVSILDFIPEDSVIWTKESALSGKLVAKELEKGETHYNKLESLLNHLTPSELYIDEDEFRKGLSARKVVEFGGHALFPESIVVAYDMLPQPAFNKNFDMLGSNLKNNEKQGYLNLVVSNQPNQIERLYNIFEDKDHEIHFKPLTVSFSSGFIDKELKVLCYTDHQIFDRYHRFRLKDGFKKSKEALTIKELSNLEPGDFVVHIDHGIGKFSGLQKIDVNGREQEAIRLEYKGGDILYVSIHSLHRISKYTGKEGTHPKVNRLGSNTWQNVKNKTKSRVKEIAFDLLKLYAKRKASKGFKYSPDTYLQTELEASFIFEDTPDQLKATIDVKRDMEDESPMDRLICGDVGFGKTEIAIRAAFKAVADGKQVAILVPTTILSLQHFRSFASRLKEFPCTVSYINRFKSGKKLTDTINRLAEGKIDILVGTHALVGKRVKFKDLGLLIIDEEQKFGVSVKDKLKTLKENVDTLTLTATPIPRTLQFSLMGARDLSIINTPPPNRYPVDTQIRPFNEETIRDAVSYEISRGGQVYFVNNKIGNIKEVAGMISRLVPDARICIGHGQMEGPKLEQVMTDFIDGSYDVLVATTIIESGIDIPNANTIIINDAQNFGLSDLHQLRGRVGRSNKKAFCYLLAPPVYSMSTEARKRLTAIEQFSDLGSGMNIAMRDLDIRGAGNLLGGEQSGFMADIGFDMYQKILNEAIQELKEQSFKELLDEEEKNSLEFVQDTVLETDFELLIPDHYVSSIKERIALYKELDDTDSEEGIELFRASLIDRFGPLPPQTESLLSTLIIRWLAKDIGFEKVILKSGVLIGHFVSRQDSPYYQSSKFTKVLDFIKKYPSMGKMYEKNGGLRMSFKNINTLEEGLDVLQKMNGIEQ